MHRSAAAPIPPAEPAAAVPRAPVPRTPPARPSYPAPPGPGTARPVRDYAALAARVAAAAAPPTGPALSCRRYGRQAARSGDGGSGGYDLLLVEVPAARPPSRRRVLLVGGVHGDEPAGAEALVRFLERRRFARWPGVAFTVVPCVNPWGYAHDRREGPGGRDLNRAFRRAGGRTPEVARLKEALGRRTFDLLVDCHEDADAPGTYVFAPPPLGAAVVAAAARLGPVHPGPAADGGVPVVGGVSPIEPAAFAALRRAWRGWPLPFYVAERHARAAAPGRAGVTGPAVPAGARATSRTEGGGFALATVETPTTLGLWRRVAIHLAAIDAAVAAVLAEAR